jgi:hypothetical protein
MIPPLTRITSPLIPGPLGQAKNETVPTKSCG